MVHAVDAADGTELWRKTVDQRFRASPAVADGRVVLGDGPLVALDTADGSELWRSDVDVSGSPTLAGETVYASTEGDVEGVGQLTAFDATDGSVRWSVDPTRDGTPWSVLAAPAVHEGTVYVPTASDETGEEAAGIHAFDAATGEREWVGLVEDRPDAKPPVVVDGSVLALVGDRVYALDAADGSKRWDTVAWQPPAVAGERAYVSENELLRALDLDTGEQVWERDIGPEGRSALISSEIVVAEDTIYVGTDATGVYAIDAETGETQDRFKPETTIIRAPPAVADGTAYITPSGERSERLSALVEGSRPPAPGVEIRTTNDPPYCVGTEVSFVWEVTSPDPDVVTEEDYERRVDVDTSDDEVGEWQPVRLTAGEVVGHVYEEPGDYEFAVTLRDPDGRTATATTTVTVVECDAPTARIETDPEDAESLDLNRGQCVTLDGSASSDPDGEIVDYDWRTLDGEFSRFGETIDFEIDYCGSKTFELRVTDDDGLTDTATVTLSTE
jgi:outer membrane protein assembly factor BamB